MYQVLEKNSQEVLVKMDIKTFKIFSEDFNEDISDYEFKFKKPVDAKKLINI